MHVLISCFLLGCCIGMPISVAVRSRAPDVIEEENSFCGPLQKELRVDDPALRAAMIAPFKGVPQVRRSAVEEKRCVARSSNLRNRLCFMASDCSGECVGEWINFVSEWEAYLAANLAIVKLVDHVYVYFSFTAAGAPAGFAADLAATDWRRLRHHAWWCTFAEPLPSGITAVGSILGGAHAGTSPFGRVRVSRLLA